MPRYNFVCPKCGMEIEKVVGIDSRNKQSCKDCSVKLRLKPAAPELFGFNNLGQSIK